MHRVRHIVVAVNEHNVPSDADANNTATGNTELEKIIIKHLFMEERSLQMIA